jgi:hypothetical protein
MNEKSSGSVIEGCEHPKLWTRLRIPKTTAMGNRSVR